MIRTVSSLTLVVILFSAADARAGAWSIGPAEPRQTKCAYNWATGEVMVSVNQVMVWNLISHEGKFTGPDVARVKEVLPKGGDWNLVSNWANTIGEGGFGAAFTYEDVYLGRVLEPGADMREFFYMESIDRFGGTRYFAEIQAIPEPSVLVALPIAMAGLAALGWKRRKAAESVRRRS